MIVDDRTYTGKTYYFTIRVQEVGSSSSYYDYHVTVAVNGVDEPRPEPSPEEQDRQRWERE